MAVHGHGDQSRSSAQLSRSGLFQPSLPTSPQQHQRSLRQAGNSSLPNPESSAWVLVFFGGILPRLNPNVAVSTPDLQPLLRLGSVVSARGFGWWRSCQSLVHREKK